MLDQLSAGDFAPHVNETFQVRLSDGQIDLRLVEVTELGRQAADAQRALPRGPFSLLFVQAPAAFYLPQRTYTLDHPALGSLEIFIVPLGSDARGMRYQAIFT